jgi:serine/threonine protein kinase
LTIDVIKLLLDEMALLWKSKYINLEIVEMAHRESNWEGGLNVEVFVSILQKLFALHEKGFVHGDIRLANLLTVSSGFIVDFDFVGLALEAYQEGLISVADGIRHPYVAAAINDRSIGTLRPAKEHDLFSMAFVLGGKQ